MEYGGVVLAARRQDPRVARVLQGDGVEAGHVDARHRGVRAGRGTDTTKVNCTGFVDLGAGLHCRNADWIWSRLQVQEQAAHASTILEFLQCTEVIKNSMFAKSVEKPETTEFLIMEQQHRHSFNQRRFATVGSQSRQR